MNLFSRGVLLLSIAMLFVSCKDDDSILGENFLDDKLGIASDTLYDISLQSIQYPNTNLVRSGTNVATIGDYHDEVFGDHKAQALFNLIPMTNEADTGANATADSLVLQLAFNGTYYGTDTSAQTFTAYRLNQDISGIDSTQLAGIGDLSVYYNESDIIGSTTYGPGKDSASQYLRITLKSELADEFMGNFNQIATDSAFKDFFKGLFIKAEKQSGKNGAIVSFKHNVSASFVRLYFSNDGVEVDESLAFDFLLYDDNNSEATSRYNFFHHTYSTGSIQDNATIDEGSGNIEFEPDQTEAYLQAMRGINLKVNVNISASTFSDIEKENLVINRAMLELNTKKYEIYDQDDTIFLAPPESITVMELTNQDYNSPELEHLEDYYAPDYGLSTSQSYDNDQNKYEIILSGFTQQKILNDSVNFNLWVRASKISTQANRAIFYSTASNVDNAKRPKLIINYSYSENTVNN